MCIYDVTSYKEVNNGYITTYLTLTTRPNGQVFVEKEKEKKEKKRKKERETSHKDTLVPQVMYLT